MSKYVTTTMKCDACGQESPTWLEWARVKIEHLDAPDERMDYCRDCWKKVANKITKRRLKWLNKSNEVAELQED